ncbi:MAG: hypothetical protein GC162_20725 [Planctomycetes bacterium]|nr:hypothetical protein [Planctomycetota bacterium]
MRTRHRGYVVLVILTASIGATYAGLNTQPDAKPEPVRYAMVPLVHVPATPHHHERDAADARHGLDPNLLASIRFDDALDMCSASGEFHAFDAPAGAPIGLAGDWSDLFESSYQRHTRAADAPHIAIARADLDAAPLAPDHYYLPTIDTVSIPEPSTMMMGLLGTLALRPRRRG